MIGEQRRTTKPTTARSRNATSNAKQAPLGACQILSPTLLNLKTNAKK
jgi:hypothetical protein